LVSGDRGVLRTSHRRSAWANRFQAPAENGIGDRHTGRRSSVRPECGFRFSPNCSRREKKKRGAIQTWF